MLLPGTQSIIHAELCITEAQAAASSGSYPVDYHPPEAILSHKDGRPEPRTGIVLGMTVRSPSPVDFTHLWMETQQNLAKMSAIALRGCWNRCDRIVALPLVRV